MSSQWKCPYCASVFTKTPALEMLGAVKYATNLSDKDLSCPVCKTNLDLQALLAGNYDVSEQQKTSDSTVPGATSVPVKSPQTIAKASESLSDKKSPALATVLPQNFKLIAHLVSILIPSIILGLWISQNVPVIFILPLFGAFLDVSILYFLVGGWEWKKDKLSILRLVLFAIVSYVILGLILAGWWYLIRYILAKAYSIPKEVAMGRLLAIRQAAPKATTSPIAGIDMSNKRPDGYVEQCLTPQFKEEEGQRKWDSDPEIRKVLDPINRGDYKTGCKEAERIVAKFSDCDFIYVYWGTALMRMGEFDQARQVFKC